MFFVSFCSMKVLGYLLACHHYLHGGTETIQNIRVRTSALRRILIPLVRTTAESFKAALVHRVDSGTRNVFLQGVLKVRSDLKVVNFLNKSIVCYNIFNKLK